MTAFYCTISILLLLLAAAATTDGAGDMEFKDPPPAPGAASNVHGKTVVVATYKDDDPNDKKVRWNLGLRNITRLVYEQMGDNRPNQKSFLRWFFSKAQHFVRTAFTPAVFYFTLGVTLGSSLPVAQWTDAIVANLKQFFDDLLFVFRGHGFSSKEEEQPYHYASYPVNQPRRAKRSGFEEVITDNVLDILTEMAGTVFDYVEELYL